MTIKEVDFAVIGRAAQELKGRHNNSLREELLSISDAIFALMSSAQEAAMLLKCVHEGSLSRNNMHQLAYEVESKINLALSRLGAQS